MNYRHVFLVTITVMLALLIISFAFFQLGWFSSGSNLTLYLRCGESPSGTLSVTIPSENSESNQKEDSFDLKTVCQRGQIDFPYDLDEENLQVVFHSHEGQTIEVIVEYGPDIQRDQNGFYGVLKVMNAPPFIMNDRI